MFEIIICDDDDACLEQTCQLVNDWKAAISTPISVKTMESGDKLLEYCAKNSPDVILLDIMMPLLNGMDAARELREHNLISKIIFLTTSPEFAIESYDVDASGYLLKPVDREKLYKLLDKCLSAVSKPADSITVHTAFGYQNVLMHHIEFLEAQNKKVILALYDGKRLEAIGKLSDYEKLLTVEKGFFNATGAILYTCRLWSIFQQLSLSQNQVQRFPFPEVFQRAFRMPISHLCLRSRLYITKKE